MMMHISDFKKMDRCEKLYWLSKRDNRKFQPFVFYNENLNELLKEKFHITNCFEGNVGDDPKLALEALSSYDVFMNARFAYDELRIKIPLMIRNHTSWDIYFSYVSCYPKEGEAQTIFDHLEVLRLLDISVNTVKIVHLNAEYIRQDTLEVDDLLQVSSYLFNHKNKPHHTIEELLSKCNRNIPKMIQKLNACNDQEMVESKRTNVCTRGMKCEYIDVCFPQPEQDTSIMHLISCSKRYEMQEAGIVDIKDVDLAKVEGTRQQYSQIIAAKSKDMYFDASAIRTWIDGSIHYPISYLDFEWETYAYPPYKGMKPFDVLCFQYSLHIEEEPDSPLLHKEFLEKGDCREDFICQLIRDIPDTGSIMVFNMDGAEKLRLQQLAQQYPKYADALHAICERMVDLALPFATANIYHNQMRGLYSLKTLVPIFSDYSYQDLDISYGMEAVRNWRMLQKVSDEEALEIRKHLLEYCAMDTYAEVLVFHAIRNLLAEKEAQRG